MNIHLLTHGFNRDLNKDWHKNKVPFRYATFLSNLVPAGF